MRSKTIQRAVAGALVVGAGAGCQVVLGLGGEISQQQACTDGVKDGDETDVDCGGGTCTPCADGKGCNAGSDCKDKVCLQGMCAAPTCHDGVQNGQETDIDCGGPVCPACAPGKHCATSTDCTSDICTATVCVANYVWAKSSGNSNSNPAAGNNVAVDAAGNAAIAGTYDGTITFGGPTLSSVAFDSFFVAKAAPDGGYLWGKSYGDSQNMASEFNITLTGDPAGDVLFGGNFDGTVDFGGGPWASQGGALGTGDLFAVKLSPLGDYVWGKDFPGDGLVNGVATDTTGAFYVTGQLMGSVSFGGPALTAQGKRDVFLAKLDASGNYVWSNAFGDAGAEDIGYGVAVDATGNVIVAGTFTGTIDFGGQTLTASAQPDTIDVFLAKLDPMGAYVWSTSFGGFSTLNPNEQSSVNVAVDASSNVILSGGFIGAVDFGGGPLSSLGSLNVFVAKFDPTGKPLWSNRYGGTSDSSGIATPNAGGGLLIAATGAGSIDFGGGDLTSLGSTSVFVAELDAMGAHVWSRVYGGSMADTATGVGAIPGGALIAGTSSGTIDFGGGPLTSAGVSDVFLAKLRVP